MSDRHKGYAVTLVEDLKDEDSEAVIAAISMIKGVASVKPVVSNIGSLITREQVLRELRSKLLEVLEVYHE